MKNKFSIMALLILCICILVGCGVPGTVCQHRDANDDNLCDRCNAAYTDGVDISACEHRDADDDALCDICGVSYADGEENPDAPSEDHKDSDKDHACDCGCGLNYGTHEDENLDHTCDYGCSERIGTHADANTDHACDYGCSVPVGDCVDVNLDHACDYNGCDSRFGTHWDTDKDHVCDYGCTEVLGVHDDLDKDHACDYCGGNIGECVDADKNHACDYGCAKTFGLHVDENKDHACDYGCDLIFGEHLDADKNHECDYGCSEKIGVHADTDMDRVCDYCGADTDHTCVDNDFNHWCDYGCEDSYFGECTDRDYDHLCDYGCGRHYCWDQDEDSYCDFGCGEHFCYDENRDHYCDFDCGNSWGMEEHFPNAENHFCLYCGEQLTECHDFDPLDHICDICGLWFGECVDERRDHLCDVCGERLSECFDDNCDHDCDVCSAVLGECFDDDNDHCCDICSAIISECINEFFDHICDICGKILIIDCIDDDGDHYCDYGCGERVSPCEDIYPCDHKCDLCGEVLSECTDADFDHKCDLLCDNYDKFYESHVDENNDHICDAYGTECLQGLIGTCEDADEDGYCDHGCGKQFEIESDVPLYTRDGDYIYFGEYPQTVKADNVTITDVQDSRGYFLGSDGCYYAKVAANLAGGGYTFSSGSEVVFEEIYYFKVEPIRWKILSLEEGVAFILCENIIANMVFDEYTGAESNNYKESDIRAWLNAQFYETAFSTLQRDLILTTLVDNSLASTGYKNNPYTCENTEDKIFLLSYADMTNNDYGFNTVSYAADAARKRMTTDYVRASGGWMSTESKYYGYGKWWLRTPYYNYKRQARCILQNGEIFDDNYIYVSNIGVVPALRIQLALHGEHYDNDYDRRCDECAMTICAHTDENSDHFCDVNGADCVYGAIGDCKDVNKDGYCDYGCGKTFEIIPDPLYVRDGDYIYFGEYPQTVKANDVTITETQDSRGYYLGSDGCYYAKVLAQPASGPSFKFSTGATISSYTTYYFKVEPIRWRILSESNGTAFILCDSIIANSAYQSSWYQSGTNWYTNANGAPADTYANNYQYSEIRAWLNAQFYETAFSDLQQALIQTVLVDNSAASTTSAANSYVCENTQDKIFLLSYKEAMNSAYGMGSKEARQMIISDYGRATGVYMATDSSYYGNGNWWLRSPRDNASNQACTVSTGGYTDQIVAVSNQNYGVVPALWIRL